MVIELFREQLCTMILDDWKIGSNYRESRARLMVAWGIKHLPIEQILTSFINTNVDMGRL